MPSKVCSLIKIFFCLGILSTATVALRSLWRDKLISFSDSAKHISSGHIWLWLSARTSSSGFTISFFWSWPKTLSHVGNLGSYSPGPIGLTFELLTAWLQSICKYPSLLSPLHKKKKKIVIHPSVGKFTIFMNKTLRYLKFSIWLRISLLTLKEQDTLLHLRTMASDLEVIVISATSHSGGSSQTSKSMHDEAKWPHLLKTVLMRTS